MTCTMLKTLIENRLQLMHDKYSFNPRRCNSASSLSGSLEVALSTTNEIVDVFEQTLTGRFSCVNTRLTFDTEMYCLILQKQPKTF